MEIITVIAAGEINQNVGVVSANFLQLQVAVVLPYRYRLVNEPSNLIVVAAVSRMIFVNESSEGKENINSITDVLESGFNWIAMFAVALCENAAFTPSNYVPDVSYHLLAPLKEVVTVYHSLFRVFNFSILSLHHRLDHVGWRRHDGAYQPDEICQSHDSGRKSRPCVKICIGQWIIIRM